ncbi:hypothetical protein EUGRSUZ_L01172 [Eucalyptus grandis]|uniref:Uncharacterized protein n=1 Tax=Eucalyptus grandis TaxID=71139 RepID=A0A058ZTS3_EUCGR|nr:hypothetical protein EUGRSUZ_L01172 [Eucalyptus grandis]
MFSMCQLLKVRVEGHCIETKEWTGKKVEQDRGSCLSFYFYSLAFNDSLLYFIYKRLVQILIKLVGF